VFQAQGTSLFTSAGHQPIHQRKAPAQGTSAMLAAAHGTSLFTTRPALRQGRGLFPRWQVKKKLLFSE